MTDDITQNDCQGEHMNSDRTGDLELCGGSLLLHEDDQGNIGGLAITGISGGADYIGDFNNGGFPRTLHLRRLDDMAGPDMCYVAEPAAETARLNAELTEAREIIAGLIDGSEETDREFQEALGELLEADPSMVNVTHPIIARARAFLTKGETDA